MLKYLLASIASAGVLAIAGCDADRSTIGGTPIPDGLHCEEDEAIQFTGPDTLDCIHIELLND